MRAALIGAVLGLGCLWAAGARAQLETAERVFVERLIGQPSHEVTDRVLQTMGQSRWWRPSDSAEGCSAPPASGWESEFTWLPEGGAVLAECRADAEVVFRPGGGELGSCERTFFGRGCTCSWRYGDVGEPLAGTFRVASNIEGEAGTLELFATNACVGTYRVYVETVREVGATGVFEVREMMVALVGGVVALLLVAAGAALTVHWVQRATGDLGRTYGLVSARERKRTGSSGATGADERASAAAIQCSEQLRGRGGSGRGGGCVRPWRGCGCGTSAA